MDMEEEEEEEAAAAAADAAAAAVEAIATPDGGRDGFDDALWLLLDAEEGEAEEEEETAASVEDDPVRAMVSVRRNEPIFRKLFGCSIQRCFFVIFFAPRK